MAGGLFGFIDSLTDDRKKPYNSCPPLCTSFPDACMECGEYNKKLEKVLFNVEHADTFFSNYVIDPSAPPGGERECYNCGAPVDVNDTECPYCGEGLSNGLSPIRVRSETDVPSPVLEAQDIILAKKEMLQNFQKQKNASNGFLGTLASMATNLSDKMGNLQKMTLSEIQETAAAYGVSVHTYLVGLDRGTYLTKAGKASQDAIEKMNQQMQAQNAARAAARPATFSSFGGAATGAVAGGMVAGRSSSSSYTMMDYMQQKAVTSAPHYSGGPNVSCYSCSYYSSTERKCAYFDKDTDAGDYCNNHRSK